MSIRNQNWYNLQSTRRYPLDDTSTGEDDFGANLRDDILVDCNIRFPDTLGRLLYVQAINVSQNLVTVVFGVGRDRLQQNNISVAAVSLVKPVVHNINYAITPLTAGVAGWVSFGPGVEHNFSGRYSVPNQSLIAARCGRGYAALPITSIGKLGLQGSLQGLVNLEATQPLTAKYVDDAGTVVTVTGDVVGAATRAIVIGLDTGLITENFNPLSFFSGPCAQRPESGTCDEKPIETINGVAPDCAGNINIVFKNFTANTFVDCGGLDILTPISLSTACDTGVDPKQEFTDICCAENVRPGELQDEFCWPDPAPDIIVEDLISSAQPCVEFPICLNSCDATAHFATASGYFLSVITTAPEPNAVGTIQQNTLADRYVLAATPSAASVGVLKNCATDWAANKRIKTTISLTGIGAEKNGGILLNYQSTVVRGRTIRKYTAVVIEAQSSKIKVLRFNGENFIEEHAVAFPAQIGVWYELSVVPIMTTGTAATLNIVARDMLSGTVATATATVAEYGEPTGRQGIFAQRSYTYFHSFEIA